MGLGILSLAADELSVLVRESGSVFSEEELARFAEARLADLVRMAVELGDELDGDWVALASAPEGSRANTHPERRLKALSILSALRGALVTSVS
jgi:hypothetical protein